MILIKYQVVHEGGHTEFLDEQEAIAYAASVNASSLQRIDLELPVETEPPPMPDWEAFLDTLQEGGFTAALFATDRGMAVSAYQQVILIHNGIGGDREIASLGFIYQGLLPLLSPEMTEVLRNAIAQHHIPIAIDG